MLNNELIEKYFGILEKFDTQSKKKLIKKLEESITVTKKSSMDIESLFGAWQDDRSSDEIIEDIKGSRVA